MNIVPEAAIWRGPPHRDCIAKILLLTRVESGDGKGNGYRRLWRPSIYDDWRLLRENSMGLAELNDALNRP